MNLIILSPMVCDDADNSLLRQLFIFYIVLLFAVGINCLLTNYFFSYWLDECPECPAHYLSRTNNNEF